MTWDDFGEIAYDPSLWNPLVHNCTWRDEGL